MNFGSALNDDGSGILLATLMLDAVGENGDESDLELSLDRLVHTDNSEFQTEVTAINGTFTIEASSAPNVALTVNDDAFGNLAKGDSLTLDPSFTLENQGTGAVKVSAYFTTNYGGVHGLVHDTYVIGGSNFGITGTSLSDDDTPVEIDPALLAGETTPYGATLEIPVDQEPGEYLGIIELIFEEV